VRRGRSHGRHSLQSPSKFHSTSPRRIARLSLVAAATTAVIVGTGALVSGAVLPTRPRPATASLSDASIRVQQDISTARETRASTLSRSTERSALPRPVPRATGKLWTTEDLDVRLAPRERTRTQGLIDDGQHVPVTGLRKNGYAQVIVRGAARWVTADYLSKTKVVDPADRGLSDAPCPDGSGIESALQSQSVKVYRAVCAAFPELSSYGGQDGHGEHVNGEAIDFMVPSSSVGEQVKDFLYAHHAELDLFDIIWSQHIWTIQRAGEGFRSMSDRGSSTANHYDHVHIKIN
jgi:hypothetical protein